MSPTSWITITSMKWSLNCDKGDSRVNIADTEEDYDMVAKTCGCKDTTRKVTYSFVDSYHSLCRDKKDMISCSRNNIFAT
jgi:hypothetical protein